MTLKQWCERYDEKPTYPTTEAGAVSVFVCCNNCPTNDELYRLSDYVVSSRSGVVVWLVPRKKETER